MSWLPISRCYFGTAYATRYERRRRRAALTVLGALGLVAVLAALVVAH